MNDARVIPILPDPQRRRLAQAGCAAGAVALAGSAVPFVWSLAPSERARAAGAPVEADLSRLAPGELATVEWRGRPVWLLRRSPDMLKRLEAARAALADPDSAVLSQQPEYARNPVRSIRPEYLVVVSLCTHLGCVPSFVPEAGSLQADWPGGFYCPCHGSKFDLAGRVFKGSPAPTNLVVPPHRFLSEQRVLIGAEEQRPA
jgi:ubiquinol-cytochrome c reductase iron-sulfur subunit